MGNFAGQNTEIANSMTKLKRPHTFIGSAGKQIQLLVPSTSTVTDPDTFSREAKDFWCELDMRKKINSAVAEVEASYHAGRLPWTYATVQSLITPYPRRGKLDVLKIGQGDEATPDADGVPWEVGEADAVEPDGADGSGACDDDADDDGEICDFNPFVWNVAPEE